MKIAIVIEHLEPWRGGAETSTLELSRLLKARGHEVHVITATPTPPPPDLIVDRIPAARVLRPLQTVTFVRRAAEFLRRSPFDRVLAISPLPEADVYQPRGGLIGETLNRNVALRPSRQARAVKRALLALNFKHRAMLELEREIFRPGGPRIAAVSGYVARQCERIYGVRPPRVRVIFNGVNAPDPTDAERAAARSEIRRQYEISDDTLLLLFMAHNFRLKGLYPLIEAVARLTRAASPPLRLLVVGRDNPVRFQRRVEALGVERQVTFAGPTQRSAAFWAAADVCVHPTYYDPCSRVVLEALWHGLPCITTVWNGAAELIRNGVEGFVIDSPDNVPALVEAIAATFSAPRRRDMSRQARALRPRMSMSRHVEELEALLIGE